MIPIDPINFNQIFLNKTTFKLQFYLIFRFFGTFPPRLFVFIIKFPLSRKFTFLLLLLHFLKEQNFSTTFQFFSFK